MKSRHHRTSSLLAASGRGIGLILVITTGLFASCISNETPIAPTSTPAMQYWLTPIQYSTKGLFTITSFPQLSTPDLIDQAFADGAITAEQRLLYLTYAFFEYESLPVQFQSNVGWRGTSILGELEKAINDPAVFCSMSPDIRSEIQRLHNPNTICN